MAAPIRNGRRWDPATPFLVFLAGGVVVVVGVLAFLTYEEGRPRRVESVAQNVQMRLLPAWPVSPEPLPIPAPTRPR
ncbi:MAG TPA: hypothetical protein VF459_15450 [Caulobacteraceae bacterium]